MYNNNSFIHLSEFVLLSPHYIQHCALYILKLKTKIAFMLVKMVRKEK